MVKDNSLLTSGTANYLDENQKLAWLRLIRSENVGPVTFHMLINRFGGAVKALAALPELSARGGLRRVITICSQEDAEREITRAHRVGLRLIAMGEPEYPKQLISIEGAPPLLYCIGDVNILKQQFVAIVGSRNCSALGRKITQMIAKSLGESQFKFGIVSGMARGIDTAAHEASLQSGTVAILASGANVIYPPENKKLYERILGEGGAILSETPPDIDPRRSDFPRRNRIISGIALGTVITEAAIRSGSLITARLAAEQGREVFAVPGSPLDPRAEGGNALLREGATLVRSADDIIEALAPIYNLPPPQIEFPLAESDNTLTPGDNGIDPAQIIYTDREKITNALSSSPIEVDEIIRHTQLPTEVVLITLLEMELAGCISRYHGDRVSSNV